MNLEQYIAKYGEKDGLRRWKKNEYLKQYYQSHREAKIERVKQYRQEHREEVLEHKKQYYQDHREEQLEHQKQYRQAHLKEKAEYLKQYFQSHREERLEYNKQYRQTHYKEVLEHKKQYYQTPYGRALGLIGGYRQKDRQQNRGECTLTAKWVVDNIFTRSCLYCGESDWHLLGCDRKNNSKPHTPENVVCSCEKCNKKRQKMDFLDYAYSIGAKDSDGLVVWNGDAQ